MKISIKDITSLPNQTREYPTTFDGRVVDYGGIEFQVTHAKPFNTSMAMEGTDKLHVYGQTVVGLAGPCDRCLESVSFEVTARFDVTVDIELGSVVDDEDIGPYPFVDGEYIDVDELVYDEIFINFPAKLLCLDDCKGLCPTCGINLNTSTCSCYNTVLDPRMAQFLDVFNSFKEV
ncbi:MAG: DUF177 domain-containing protein, partial [Pseudobutyrivibrio sp.]|nr:DUF177 domain-containing protein [Pseudobutyrivibrio sp.]